MDASDVFAGIAAAVAVVGTGVTIYQVASGRSYTDTRVTAAQEQTEALRAQVEVLESARQDASRPVLSVGRLLLNGQRTLTVTLRNVGAGPAIDPRVQVWCQPLDEQPSHTGVLAGLDEFAIDAERPHYDEVIPSFAGGSERHVDLPPLYTAPTHLVEGMNGLVGPEGVLVTVRLVYRDSDGGEHDESADYTPTLNEILTTAQSR